MLIRSLIVDLSCYSCTAGNAYPNGADAKTPCVSGFYSDANADSCTSCPPGKQCPSSLAADVEMCPAGTYSLGKAQACTTCPTGKS